MSHPPSRIAALDLAQQLAPKGERAEIVVTALVVAVVFAMLLPVPTWLLDLLIAINLCVSAFLIVLVMQVRQTTGLSAFPSLFLVTTLFRVALSVASTRQILLNGEAGHIIEAFGQIVVGGNLVVGLVIFLVLTVVQFIVITKGSERVAEVGARFSLDAMPGRQMAIDMERKAGGITQDEAKAQRDALTEESQFFGAMDGTMKFAKGDSIVGIVIVLVNLLGGLSIGVMQRGMPASEALQVYAILTIGDGLVAQIPALLMSMTAGLLVTRVSKPTGGRAIGNELTAQLLHQPKAWVTASGAMLAFGLLPGMPLAAFAGLAAGSAAVGLSAMYRKLKIERDETNRRDLSVEAMRDFDIVRPFALRISSRVDAENALRALNACRHVRNDLVRRLALVTPPIEVDNNVDLDDADLEFCHGEVRVFSMWLREDLRTCTWLRGDPLDLGLPAEQVEPRAGLACAPRVWLPEADAAALDPAPADLQDCWARLSALCEETLLRIGPMYFGMEEAQKIAAWCGRKTPEVAKELERAVPLSRMAEVLRRLLTENVSIRNLPMILNALIDWGPRERDPSMLTECVRGALQREICDAHAVRKELRALMLDSELETHVRAAVRQTAYGDFLALDADLTDAILDETAAAYVAALGGGPLVLVCAQDVRPHLRKLLADRLPALAVIGMSELPPDFRVNVRSVVSVPLDGSAMSEGY
ncbi:flagellar biosynthesis protein FlhA [Mitsuaria sp. GD03876]|uniref:flagellar biosynthesis protein FlhA n=1 Tax=Mitsuaria sp. GD03876 TaxID=2975399 RepID=UPI00244D280E|nr:flagellar biosynthesis protein FlhA [Mitsuaria sp. GD03876]MDH0865334.1 flagellar biosynthesis protein FlhA [Mitsuaria sp. GD03876]